MSFTERTADHWCYGCFTEPMRQTLAEIID